VPMQVWKTKRDEVLVEMMRMKGRGTFTADACSRCGCIPEQVESSRGEQEECRPGLFRCKECFSQQLLCGDCCVEMHACHPLHCIEEWTGRFFRRSWLFNLGLVVELGHEDSTTCTVPCYRKTTVIHTTGIQHVQVSFCGCSNSSGTPMWKQAIRREWYPATLDKPKTFTTFAVLNSFHKLTLEGKSTTYDYYSSLQLLSNNTG
ncbi:hypothetical protein BT96DRAFT_797707, partial [Gymnopus androsaceus JB14]